MAQAGLYVPADSFVFFPYNTLFTRILGHIIFLKAYQLSQK